MENLKTKIELFRSDIELVISGLDRFKVVMQAIADIKKLVVQSEVQYYLYQVSLTLKNADKLRPRKFNRCFLSCLDRSGNFQNSSQPWS